MKGHQRFHSAAGLGHVNALRKAAPGLGLEVVWIERAQVAGWGRSPVGGQGLPGSSTGGSHSSTSWPQPPSHLRSGCLLSGSSQPLGLLSPF